MVTVVTVTARCIVGNEADAADVAAFSHAAAVTTGTVVVVVVVVAVVVARIAAADATTTTTATAVVVVVVVTPVSVASRAVAKVPVHLALLLVLPHSIT